MILGGAATAAVILTAWLPVGALIAQHSALSAASSRLSQLSAEGVALTAEEARLQTPAVIDQLAREQYQLVEPGQRLVQVLTPSFRPTSQRADGGPFPGDPGYAPVVDPADATSGPDPPPASRPPAHVVARPAGPGYLSRVLSTLEFWR